jgi:N-carbamoyl-L-amino-acid hydrolase
MTRAIEADAATASRAHRTGLEVSAESVSAAVEFDGELRERLSAVLGGGVPVLPTGAGHDAGVLSAVGPTAMLFVRNPTGVSHSPAEQAEDGDCVAGVRALALVLAGLAGQ